MVATPAIGQEVMDDGSRVVLPLETQQCDLPTAPPPIPETPMKEDLLKAQKAVKQFQKDMEIYRACISDDSLSDTLSDGNRVAVTNAHNYSVEMEERVATMFNEAVRAYKARYAKDSN